MNARAKAYPVRHSAQPAKGPHLSPAQIEAFTSQMIDEELATPVRFFWKDRNIDVIYGTVAAANAPLSDQYMYWNFLEETALEIAEALGVEARLHFLEAELDQMGFTDPYAGVQFDEPEGY